MTREELEELTWQLVELTRSLADKSKQHFTNSSRPPSSDDPYRRRDERQKVNNAKPRSGDVNGVSPSAATNTKPSRPPGEQPGTTGFWRRQPMVVDCDVDHDPVACGLRVDIAQRCRRDSAPYVDDLERTRMTLQIRNPHCRRKPVKRLA